TTEPGPAPSVVESAAVVTPAPLRPVRRDRVARIERTGELAIIVRPWAMIWVNGKPSGQTPFRAALPAGRYRVRLANDEAGHDEITTVTVEPGRTATIARVW
ncbi:MAG TPA: PEGA domain-containing protein, partial [Kofleriaceae bacterium]